VVGRADRSHGGDALPRWFPGPFDGKGYIRSFVRNLPLVIPGWNLVEVLLVLLGKPRTGDRIAKTTVTEE
jgi:hypothetical protein